MAENTVLNVGSGGDTIATEDIGAYKLPVSKIRIGATDVDGGDVTTSNPFPVVESGAPAVVNPYTLGAEQPVYDSRLFDMVESFTLQVVDAIQGGMVGLNIGVTNTPPGQVSGVDAAGAKMTQAPVVMAGAYQAPPPFILRPRDNKGNAYPNPAPPPVVKALSVDPNGELILAADAPLNGPPPSVSVSVASVDETGALRSFKLRGDGRLVVDLSDVTDRLDILIDLQTQMLAAMADQNNK